MENKSLLEISSEYSFQDSYGTFDTPENNTQEQA